MTGSESVERIARTLKVKPQTLMFMFYSEFGLVDRQFYSAKSILQVFSGLGVNPNTTRTTLIRMVDRDLLARAQVGRSSYFGITDRAANVLSDGARRVWDGVLGKNHEQEWTLITFSLPETRRADRHQLRSELTWLGFGALKNGIWITPSSVDVSDLLQDPRFDGMDAFMARPVRPGRAADMIREAFDLESLATGYREFINRWEQVGATREAEHLPLLLCVMADWIQSIRRDPRIPVALLPHDWPAGRAEAIFRNAFFSFRAGARRTAGKILEVVPPGEDSTGSPHASGDAA